MQNQANGVQGDCVKSEKNVNITSLCINKINKKYQFFHYIPFHTTPQKGGKLEKWSECEEKDYLHFLHY